MENNKQPNLQQEQQDKVKQLETILSDKDSVLWQSFLADVAEQLIQVHQSVWNAKSEYERGEFSGYRNYLMWANSWMKRVEGRLVEIQEQKTDDGTNPLED